MCSRTSDRGRLALGMLLLGSCSIGMDLPAGSLRLDSDRDQVKATTPADARIWVREFRDPDGDTLGFWAKALRNELVRNRGYELLSEHELNDAARRPGIELRFSVNREGEAHGYLVALFVIEGVIWADNTIRVAGFAARKPLFERYLNAVHAALSTLD